MFEGRNAESLEIFKQRSDGMFIFSIQDLTIFHAEGK